MIEEPVKDQDLVFGQHLTQHRASRALRDAHVKRKVNHLRVEEKLCILPAGGALIRQIVEMSRRWPVSQRARQSRTS